VLNPTRGLNWVSRALILSFACVGITLVAHAIAGGAVPLVGILLVSLLMTLGALFATSRELRTSAMLAFVAGSQVVCHVLLNGFGHGAESGTGTLVATSSERGSHALMHGMPIGAVPSETVELTASTHSLTLGMILAHAVACLAAALVLREGERVMFSLHRVLPQVLRVLFGAILGHLPAARPIFATFTRPVEDTLPHAFQTDLVHNIARRGPPAFAI
jgi:hypothetical protein